MSTERPAEGTGQVRADALGNLAVRYFLTKRRKSAGAGFPASSSASTQANARRTVERLGPNIGPVH